MPILPVQHKKGVAYQGRAGEDFKKPQNNSNNNSQNSQTNKIPQNKTPNNNQPELFWITVSWIIDGVFFYSTTNEISLLLSDFCVLGANPV